MSEPNPSPRVLHIGAGLQPTPGAVNHDLHALPGIDVAHDLEIHPWPWADGSFDVVIAIDVLEHLNDFVGAMEEIYRITTPGAEVRVQMPYHGSMCHATDPTHRRGCTEHTFGYFDPEHPHCKAFSHYSTARFKLHQFGHEVPESESPERFQWRHSLTMPPDWQAWMATRAVGGNCVFVLRRLP